MAFYPRLFDRDRLKRGITAHDLLGPFEGRDITPTYARLFQRLINEYADHFATPKDCARIRAAVDLKGIDGHDDVYAVGNVARRFGDDAGAFYARDAHIPAPAVRRPFGKEVTRPLTARETMAKDYVERWVVSPHDEETTSLADALRRKRRFTLADVSALLFKLVPDDREALFAVLEREGLARMFPLPSRIVEWIEETERMAPSSGHEGARSLLIADPVVSLKAAASVPKVDEQLYVRVYIRTFIRHLADPARLIRFMGALPVAAGLVAPPLPRNDQWPELIAFLERHGFDAEDAAAWFDSLRNHEPSFEEHLRIALAARLKPLFMSAWAGIDRRAYYEDLLDAVSPASGLAATDVAAWLAWNYRGDDRKVVGALLGEHTMLGWQFDQMRKMRRRPILENERQRLQRMLQEARNRRARNYTKVDWRRTIELELESLGLTIDDLLQRLCAKDEDTGFADPAGTAWFAMALNEAGIPGMVGTHSSMLRGGLPTAAHYAPMFPHPHSIIMKA